MSEPKVNERKASVFLISIVVTTILVAILFMVGEGGITHATDFSLGPNSNPSYSSNVIDTKGPNYFFPSADVSAYMATPYAKYVENFTLYESIDNSTWVQIPLSDTPNNYTKIGTVPLNGFNTPIYLKAYLQYQNITIQNQTISISDFIDSLYGQFHFAPSPTPQTIVIFILLIIAVFSFTLQIVDFLTREDSKEKPTV